MIQTHLEELEKACVVGGHPMMHCAMLILCFFQPPFFAHFISGWSSSPSKRKKNGYTLFNHNGRIVAGGLTLSGEGRSWQQESKARNLRTAWGQTSEELSC